MPSQLQSFDVFDTLLTRTVAVPGDLFLEWEQRLAAAGLAAADTPRQLARARMEAERAARRPIPEGEVTLAEIYAELARPLAWKQDQRDRAMQIELDLESASLQAVPGMVNRVAEARRKAHQILFLTDMYLPAVFIEGVLRREGFFQDGDRLFVSGESKRSKHKGQMFAEVKRLFPGTANWQHTGDNLHADVDMARQSGVGAQLEPRCLLTRYERLARGRENETSLWRSKLAGAMRLTRLENPETDDHRCVIWDTACNVVGLLLFGFVHWCLETARQRGLRRLYFVARDGQILQRIAKVVAANWDYDVDCRYLYGSRQAWRPAAVGHLTPSDIHNFFNPIESVSLEEVFARLELSLENYHPQLERFGLAKLDRKQNLTQEARQRLGECLWDGEMAVAVERVSHAKRARLVDYLRQEGFWDGVPFALVDIGWYGNLQRSLSRVLQLSGDVDRPQLEGLYFALYLADPHMSDYWHALASRKNTWREQYQTFFEIFTAADHGSVLGFEKEEGRVEPRLAQERNTRALDWGLLTLHAAILRFAETFTKHVERKAFAPSEFLSVSNMLLNEFYTHPSRAEAVTWGRFQFSGGQIESRYEQLVPQLNHRQVLAAILDRRKRPACWWLEGTQAICRYPSLYLFLILKRWKERLRNKAFPELAMESERA